MGHIQRERLPKSQMASSDKDGFTFENVHVLNFRNGLNEELCSRFIFTNLQQSLGKVWLEILLANLATNFQDLVAKVKNLVALAHIRRNFTPWTQHAKAMFVFRSFWSSPIFCWLCCVEFWNLLSIEFITDSGSDKINDKPLNN